MIKTLIFDIVESTLGRKEGVEEITFKSEEDLEEAYRQIDLGYDIKVVKQGVMTILPHRMLSSKIYDGTLKLSAKIGGNK